MRRCSRVVDPIIYGLRDPRDGRIRYVGKSRNGIERARQHYYESRRNSGNNPHKDNWIGSLKAAGLRYETVILERLTDEIGLNDAESHWIAIGRSALGDDFTNATDGGEGCRGWKPPQGWRIKQSEAQKGRPKSPETVERMRASYTPERLEAHSARLRGKKRTPEQIARCVAGHGPWTAERYAKHLEAHLGKKRSDETRRKLSEKAKLNFGKRQRNEAGQFA